MLCSLARLVQVLRRSPWAVAVRFRPPPFQFHSKNNGLPSNDDDMVVTPQLSLPLVPKPSRASERAQPNSHAYNTLSQSSRLQAICHDDNRNYYSL